MLVFMVRYYTLINLKPFKTDFHFKWKIVFIENPAWCQKK